MTFAGDANSGQAARDMAPQAREAFFIVETLGEGGDKCVGAKHLISPECRSRHHVAKQREVSGRVSCRAQSETAVSN
jgi:hypothetical protein